MPGALASDGPLRVVLELGHVNAPWHRGTIKGAMFELEAALKLKDAGQVIIGFDQKIKSSTSSAEFDIVTEDMLVECKNWSADFDLFPDQATRARSISSSIGKQYMIVFKKQPGAVISKYLYKHSIQYEVI